MNILKCQGWQCHLVYFERQTISIKLWQRQRQTMYHEYIKMSRLAMPLSIL